MRDKAMRSFSTRCTLVRARLYACVALQLASSGAIAQTAPNRDQANAHGGKAIQLMQERRYSEAAAEFEQSLEANPDDDGIRIQYATCLFIQERNREARREFEKEVQRLGPRPGLNYFLGRLDLRANDAGSAIGRLLPLTANPAFPKAFFYLGLAYLANGQAEKALESLQLAAKSNPDDPEVHYRLGRVYASAGRMEDGDREFEIYRKAREIQRVVEEDGHACMDALRAQPIGQAKTICQKIADPHDARRMVLLGELYAGSGAYAEAVEPLRTAVSLDPNSFDGWHNLGRSLFALRRYQEAVPALEKAVALNPRYFDTLNLLAAAYHSLGDDASALPILERAHTLNPSDAKVAAALDRMRAARKDKP